MCRALSRLLFLARLAFRSASCRCPSERAWVRARVAPSSLPGSLFARLVVAAPHERAPSSCARPGRADSSVWTHRRSSAAGSASGARRPRSQSGCFESGCGSGVERDVEERDRYGRTLVYLRLPDGRSFNELLVAEGYAVPLTIPPNVRHAERFRELARRARERAAGLWSSRSCGGDPDRPMGWPQPGLRVAPVRLDFGP
jgi:Staphylococcal nuclease homologue